MNLSGLRRMGPTTMLYKYQEKLVVRNWRTPSGISVFHTGF